MIGILKLMAKTYSETIKYGGERRRERQSLKRCIANQETLATEVLMLSNSNE